MKMTPEQLARAREQWTWTGQARPAFAQTPLEDQVSVWDFPRPPALVPEKREIVVLWGDLEVASTTQAWKVLETAHPPTYYLPLSSVRPGLLQSAGQGSFCEWKGPAQYWDLVNPEQRLNGVAWSYLQPLEEARSIAHHIAFYAHKLHCTVGGAQVLPQPGGFYGGWITHDLAGPFKGEPGSSAW